MTSRANAEAARRRKVAKGVGLPRDVFTFRYWVSGWVHPFESRLSAYQKYAWLNNASRHEHFNLVSNRFWSYDRHVGLEARLFAALPEQHRAPRIELWDAADFPQAICLACLETGYWSELPQLTGYDQCPLHGIPLQRRCRSCLLPLRFGCPRFGETGAFVCQSCGEHLTALPTNVCLQWHHLPVDTLISRFAPLNAIAQRLAAECGGHWMFPTRGRSIERQLILHTLTGRRLHHELDGNGVLFADGTLEQVVPVTFVLPCDEVLLATELADTRRALIADVMRHFRQHPHVGASVARTVGMKSYFISHGVEIRTGGSLVDNVNFVLQFFSEGKKRMSHRSLEEHIQNDLKMSDFASPFLDLIATILQTFSVWQVTRVLLWLDSLAHTMMERLTDAGHMNDAINALLEGQPYSIRLIWGRIEEGHFDFELLASSWIPPYRLRNTTQGTELTIFQIVPKFDGQGGGGRRYYDRPVVEPHPPV